MASYLVGDCWGHTTEEKIEYAQEYLTALTVKHQVSTPHAESKELISEPDSDEETDIDSVSVTTMLELTHSSMRVINM